MFHFMLSKVVAPVLTSSSYHKNSYHFRFLCIFTSASFRIEILVFRIRICDVTLSSNYRFHLEFCGTLCLHF